MKAISKETFNGVLKGMDIADISRATIRQCVNATQELERISGEKYVHLEFGVPGIKASQIGIDMQKEALDAGIASVYPPTGGIPEFKWNASAFIKAFIGVDIFPDSIIPTVGSMQGCFNLLLECSQLHKDRKAVIYISPGFPSHYLQAKILGLEARTFDIYDNRGDKLGAKLEELLSDGKVCAIVYSNPNNPSWVCLTEDELRTIGEVCTRHDADNYALMLSASKIFSYAGERIGLVAISNKLYAREYPRLHEQYGLSRFGDNFVLTFIYVNSSGCSRSAQNAMSAMMEASVSGRYDFVAELREYERRAHKAKEIFFKHGFSLVYDKDMGQDVSDGFFFTMGYEGMSGSRMLSLLMRCGIGAITLNATRSRQEGIRVCVSMLNGEEDFRKLDERLGMFTDLLEEENESEAQDK